MNLIELVPREREAFLQEARDIRQSVPAISGINVPDVMRLDNRSTTAVQWLLEEDFVAIPHIRSSDRPIADILSKIGALMNLGLNHVLIISGDDSEPDALKAISLIEATRLRYPRLKIYGGLDPYRQSFQKELAYCQAKKEAGADGFFTQPFFDPELARIYIEQLENEELFIGISPVLSDKSLAYWKTRNHAIFPKNFELSLEGNIQIGAQIVNVAKKYGKHTYLMPIKAPVVAYTKGVFDQVLL